MGKRARRNRVGMLLGTLLAAAAAGCTSEDGAGGGQGGAGASGGSGGTGGFPSVTVHPTEIDAILRNPGMGFESFHRYDGDLTPQEHPETSVAYFRWYWDSIEPVQGEIDFAMIDQVVQQARDHDQTLGFRIMAADGGVKVPQWLLDMGIGGVWFDGGQAFMPDFADPLFMQEMERVVRAFADRYAENPTVDHVDIGSLGRWGEWHVSGVDGAEMPPTAIKLEYVDWYLEAFAGVPLVMLIGDLDGLTYAVEHGAGFRGDCLGDMGGFSDTWNHMDWYPEQIEAANATEAWKTAPIAFEVCWTMDYWVEQGWDIDTILDAALDMHISLLNAKSAPIPDEYWPAVEQFQKKMGYRLVMRELSHQPTVSAGGVLNVSSVWENVGVAPPYRRYPLAYRLVDEQGQAQLQAASTADVTTWLPGEDRPDDALEQAASLPPGPYRLDVALMRADESAPGVQLAIEGRLDDGWYAISEVEVQ